MKRGRENASSVNDEESNELTVEESSHSPSKKQKLADDDDPSSAEKKRVLNMLRYQEHKEEPTALIVSELREKSTSSLGKVIEKSKQRKEKNEELKKTGRMRNENDRMNEFEQNIKNATEKQSQVTVERSDKELPQEEVITLEEEEDVTQPQNTMEDDNDFESVMSQTQPEASMEDDEFIIEGDAIDEAFAEEAEDQDMADQNKTFEIETDIPDDNESKKKQRREEKQPEKQEKPKTTRTLTVKRKTKNERQSDLEVYKLYLTTFLAYHLRRNTLADSPVIQGLLYSMIPENIHSLFNKDSSQDMTADKQKTPSKTRNTRNTRSSIGSKSKPTNDMTIIQQLVKWFQTTFEITPPDVEEKSYRQSGISYMYNLCYETTEESLVESIESKNLSDSDSFIVFLSLFRCLGILCREVGVINPDEMIKLLDIEKKTDSSKKKKQSEEPEESNKKKKRRSTKKKKDENHNSTDEEVDEYIEETKKTKRKKNSIAKAVTSSDSSKTSLHHNDIWIEMFSTNQKSWIRIDPEMSEQKSALQSVMNTFKYTNKKASTSPSKDTVTNMPTRICDYPPFIVACGRDNAYVSDITYNFYITKGKDTISGHEQFDEAYSWFRELLTKCSNNESYSTLPETERHSIEDEQEKIRNITEELMKILPKNQDAYKAHPLYIIEKWVTRYEALYPPNPPVVGKCGKHDVYSRSYLHILHTKDRWIKDQGKQVKQGEKPYKVVKASHLSSGANCELYGEWQTEDYVPPVAKDGKVPKNERGQVDLWHERMLPTGTVHLNLKGVAAVAKKLNIDYAPAMTGFEVRQRRSVPRIEGIIVCSEYDDLLRDAYVQNQRQKLERLKKRKDQRIRKNWRRLILRIMAREDINSRFGHLLEQEQQKQEKRKNKNSDNKEEVLNNDSDDEERDEDLEEGFSRVNGVVVEMETL
jgi:hypothetical protein